MKVYVYPGDLGGCGFYRMIWPAEEARRQGWDVEIRMPDSRELSALVDTQTRKVIDVEIPGDADVMVFQRLTNVYMAQTIPIIEAKGVACVVDQDDDLSRVHQSNPAYRAMDPRRQRAGLSDHSWLAAEEACAVATLVTVSAPALLKRYAKHGRGVVVRNAVPDSYLEIEHEDSDLIGWPARLSSHANDASRLGGTIARLQLEGFRFATIGDPAGIAGALKLKRDFHAFGPVSIDDWPATLTQLGIGLAPLDYDTEFNHAKSWLKPLELAAVGVPVVMSPGREYRRIHELGIGVLAYKPAAFYDTLRRLLKSPQRRAEMSARGREIAATLTLSRQLRQWTDAWELAYQLKRSNQSEPVKTG